MLSCGENYKPEPYKAYKNRVIMKHLEKIKNQIRQIDQCSLKPEDKTKLKKQLSELIKTSTK